jgi:hypothetical protein
VPQRARLARLESSRRRNSASSCSRRLNSASASRSAPSKEDLKYWYDEILVERAVLSRSDFPGTVCVCRKYTAHRRTRTSRLSMGFASSRYGGGHMAMSRMWPRRLLSRHLMRGQRVTSSMSARHTRLRCPNVSIIYRIGMLLLHPRRGRISPKILPMTRRKSGENRASSRISMRSMR